MFYESKEYPFTQVLEDNWEVIYKELQYLKNDDLKQWHEKRLHNNDWKVFALLSFGEKIEQNCEQCPETTALLEKIPEIITAGFSVLLPGSHIKPHKGYSKAVLRGHLGLETSRESSIKVNGVSKTWEQGKCLIFDDTYKHEAWNQGQKRRAVLLFDFKKKERPLNWAEKLHLRALRMLARKST